MTPSLPSRTSSTRSKVNDQRSKVSTLGEDIRDQDHLGLSESTLVGGSFLAGLDIQSQGSRQRVQSRAGAESKPVSPMEFEKEEGDGVSQAVSGEEIHRDEEVDNGIGDAFKRGLGFSTSRILCSSDRSHRFILFLFTQVVQLILSSPSICAYQSLDPPTAIFIPHDLSCLSLTGDDTFDSLNKVVSRRSKYLSRGGTSWLTAYHMHAET